MDFRHQRAQQQQAQAAALAAAQQAAGPPVLVRPLPTPHSSSAFSGASRTSSYATTPSEDGQPRRPSGPLEQSRGSYRPKDPSTHVSSTHPQPPQRAPSPLPPLLAAHGHHPRQASAPNLAPPPPRSPTSPVTPSHPLTFSPRSMLTPLSPGSFVTATKDHETYSYVDLAACTSPAALRETVLTKLQIQDDEFWACEFFQTRIGGGKGPAPERRIADDDELWDACCKAGDAGYTVFVKMRHQAAPDHLPTGASAAGGGRQAYPGGGGGAHSPTAVGPPLHRRRKSASVSSKSDLSSPFSPVGGPGEHAGTGRTSPQVNEFGEVVLGAHASAGPGTGSGGRGERVQAHSWSQPPPPGHGHLASGSVSSVGGLAAPDQRPRAGSLTPTAPPQEDYVWVEDPRRTESMRRPSMGQLQPMQKQVGPPPPMLPTSQGLYGVGMLPSGPVRRLPGPPQPLQQHSYAPSDHEPPPQERRQRTQTAAGSVANQQAGPPLPMPSVSAAGWRPPSAHYQPPQPVRPLPSTTPGHPNFNIVSTPSSQYHNLALQDRDAFRHHHAPPPASPQQQQTYFAPHPAPPTLGPPRQVMVTKSVDNLREHYAHAFDSDLRPKPPSGPPGPPQYRTPPIGSYSGGPPRPPQFPMPPPNAQQQYSPQPPQNRGQPPNRGGPPPQARQPPSTPQSQPSYPPVNQPYKGFDISVMRPNGPPSSTSLPAGNHTLPMRNSQRPATSNGPYASPILNQAPPPHVWQQQQQQPHGLSPPRRLTNEWSPRPQDRAYPPGVGRFAGPPPPSLPDVSGGIPLHPGEILQHSHPRRPSDREWERDAHSPTSPLAHPPPSATLMMANDPAWAEEMRRSQTYSHSTAYGPEAIPARREASASGVDGSRRQSEGSRDREPRRLSRETVPSSLQPGGKERDSGSSTGSLGWKPTNRVQQAQDGAYDGLQDESAVYNSPPSSASARSSTSASGPITPVTNVGAAPMTDAMWAEKAARQEAMHAAGPGALPMIAGADDPAPGGDDWTVFLKTFNKAPDGEATITSTDSATLHPAPSTKPTTPVTPTSVEPTLTPFSPYEDDDDEEESATYLPGFGPTRTPSATVTTPSATVGFTLSDQPTRGSPATERRPRLPQLIINDSASAAAGAADAPASGDLKSSESERSTSQLRRPSAVQKRSQHLQSQSQSSSDNSPIVRRGSFADREKRKSDWAFRPKVEDVLENLEVFFPKHELDKEVFDAPVPTPATPSPTASPAKESPPKPIPAPLKRVGATGLGYKKSIRVVAGDRRGNMLKASAREKHAGDAAPASVMRRKSTKLFGSRLEEVTPAQMKQMDVDTIAEAPVDDPDNFSFKWIKGELIGRGSYGKVYIAFNVTAGEAIAVKQVELPSTMSDKEDLRIQGMVASLKAEIELLKDLSHDNIVEYLGMEETPEHLSIFLEYVPGGSVGRMIRTHGKFPEDVIKHFTFQILTGLRYLHNLGILHRDLKGDNILCDQDGVCKISDFGTSKKSQDIYNNDANMSMQGSIFWMAPEVIQNNQQGYSAKADIWSLGCLCLEMFAGRRPWDKKEVFETMFKLGAERLAPPVPEDVILSELAKAFFSACFQGDPDMRPRADQLMRHRFLELCPDYAFTKTTLYRAIASKGDDVQTPSP